MLNIMLYRRIYSFDGKKKIYFCGKYNYEQGIVEWKWTYDRSEAKEIILPEAWELVFNARKLFKARIELERDNTCLSSQDRHHLEQLQNTLVEE